MYNFLKKSIKTLIPKRFLFNNELFFRTIYGFFYLGKRCECNICNNNLRTFVRLQNKDLLCPFCGSISRTRRLWLLLHESNSLKGNVLHFSPSRSIYRLLKKNNAIAYYSSDFEDEFLADYKFDITNVDQPNETFDTIICYHILEHIIDDVKAMQELYRVLKPNGKLYIQTPFKSGDIYENYAITNPKEREKHFGQHDHVRIYSIDGLKSRLIQCNFNVNVHQFKKQHKDSKFGFDSPEIVLVVTKS